MYDHFEFFDEMKRKEENIMGEAQRVIAYHWKKKLLKIKKKKRAAQKKNFLAENRANLNKNVKTNSSLNMQKNQSEPVKRTEAISKQKTTIR